MTEQRPPDERRRRGPRLLGLVAAGVVWLLVAGPPVDQPVAGWVGMLLFHLMAASLIRWLYLRAQKPRPPVLSPTLFLIAAGIAALGRFNQAG